MLFEVLLCWNLWKTTLNKRQWGRSGEGAAKERKLRQKVLAVAKLHFTRYSSLGITVYPLKTHKLKRCVCVCKVNCMKVCVRGTLCMCENIQV